MFAARTVGTNYVSAKAPRPVPIAAPQSAPGRPAPRSRPPHVHHHRHRGGTHLRGLSTAPACWLAKPGLPWWALPRVGCCAGLPFDARHRAIGTGLSTLLALLGALRACPAWCSLYGFKKERERHTE